MPKPRDPKLETPTARRKLAVAKKPYYRLVAPGISVGYRRNQGAGTWSVRASDGHGGEWVKRIALANDLEAPSPPDVLDYWQALEAARKLGRRQPGAPADDSRPLTVGEAVDRYETHLRQNGGDPYNASRARRHLTATLMGKPISLIGREELLRWRDSLLAKGLSPASVNRTATVVRAALELAASRDRRVTNRAEFRAGLPVIKGARRARNIILDDEIVRELVACAYTQERKLGLLLDVLAVTGCRPSQVARLQVKDLIADPVAPSLRMPRSAKGGASDRVERKATRYSVPITPALAAVLAQETAGRAGDDLLLTQANGRPWGPNPNANYRSAVIGLVKLLKLDPGVTAYSLRHSAICRALRANVPIRMVAALADTSVREIERTYSDLITEVGDDSARRALLQPAPAANGKVVSLPVRKA